jgi:hypothetical protein
LAGYSSKNQGKIMSMGIAMVKSSWESCFDKGCLLVVASLSMFCYDSACMNHATNWGIDDKVFTVVRQVKHQKIPYSKLKHNYLPRH